MALTVTVNIINRRTGQDVTGGVLTPCFNDDIIYMVRIVWDGCFPFGPRPKPYFVESLFRWDTNCVLQGCCNQFCGIGATVTPFDACSGDVTLQRGQKFLTGYLNGIHDPYAFPATFVYNYILGILTVDTVVYVNPLLCWYGGSGNPALPPYIPQPDDLSLAGRSSGTSTCSADLNLDGVGTGNIDGKLLFKIIDPAPGGSNVDSKLLFKLTEGEVETQGFVWTGIIGLGT